MFYAIKMLDIQDLDKDLTTLLLHDYGITKDKVDGNGIIPEDSSLHEDLSLSPISVLRLRFDIHTYYRVIILDEDAVNLKTFSDVIKYIRENYKG